MATEQSSPGKHDVLSSIPLNLTSESPSRKRPRRSKQEPQHIIDNSTTEETEMDTTSTNSNKRSSIKKKTKPLHSVDSIDTSADLYEPGDIVWCKLGGFPWWPALIYRCNAEGGIHTKTLNSNNKPKRLFFVYFYGKYLEYSWISTRWLLKYAGLSNFIQHAEAAVQQASTKSEQQELANRYQLKVSMKKRVQWDEAIELADRALTMTNDERIKEFSDLLKDASNQSKSGIFIFIENFRIDNNIITGVRRPKTSIEKSQNEEEDGGNKQHARDSSISSVISIHDVNDRINTVEKSPVSLRKSILLNQNDSTALSEDEQVVKKKRGRKRKSEIPNETNNNNLSNLTNTTTNDNEPMKTRTRTLSPNKDQTVKEKPIRKSRRSAITNGNEIEYDEPPLSHRSDQQTSSPVVHLIQANNPPLSNYEQKQIVEGLLHHPKEKTLTFDEAQTYAINKAIEIVYENHNYRMNNISPEWFYESILLKYPSVVFKYRSWFEHVKIDVIPNGNDMIKLKQWQIALMLHAQIKAEQQQQQQE
ncbi:unnamed protein product [Rotaria sordida]|uniref:PWWP domain-containing protein n=1 Tax=Rotaria sordida TaxID=392033 RepID=A0A819NW81_9BILA|nr:unnamed protein product [Rotaria sordida]CAF4001162.1 unnamed protein product [Rotaria sordida]